MRVTTGIASEHPGGLENTMTGTRFRMIDEQIVVALKRADVRTLEEIAVIVGRTPEYIAERIRFLRKENVLDGTLADKIPTRSREDRPDDAQILAAWLGHDTVSDAARAVRLSRAGIHHRVALLRMRGLDVPSTPGRQTTPDVRQQQLRAALHALVDVEDTARTPGG